jgi:hypothetical protein
MLKKIGLLLCGTAAAFAMNSASININDKDLEIAGRLDVGQFNYSVQPDTVFLGAKYLKGSDQHSDFSHNTNGFYELNFLMQKGVPNTALTLGLGVKLNYTQADIAGSTRDFVSIPLGVEARYKLPFDRFVPLYVGGSLYYAPQVLSMSDADNFLEYRVHLDVEVIQNGYVMIGYRSIDTNYKIDGTTYNENYNHSFYAGFKFRF